MYNLDACTPEPDTSACTFSLAITLLIQIYRHKCLPYWPALGGVGGGLDSAVCNDVTMTSLLPWRCSFCSDSVSAAIESLITWKLGSTMNSINPEQHISRYLRHYSLGYSSKSGAHYTGHQMHQNNEMNTKLRSKSTKNADIFSGNFMLCPQFYPSSSNLQVQNYVAFIQHTV